MKKLQFILIIFIVLLVPDVFAQEVNVTSNCYGSTGYANMYNGHEVQYQTDSLYTFGTTYQFQLSSFETELRYNFAADTDYTLTINTNNSDDFRNNFRTYNVYDLDNNNNNLVKSFTFISMKKVQIAFITTSATSRVQIQMGGSNVYDNITGQNNWNIKTVVLTVPDTAPSGSTNQDIIDNQTNNTNNIINNNNQNTSDIINNNNTNTQEIKDSINDNLNTCRDSYNLWSFNSEYTNPTGVDIWSLPDSNFSLPAGTYTFSADITKTNGGSNPFILFNYKYSSLTDNFVSISNSHTFTFTDDVVRVALYLPSNTSVKNIMLNEGSSAKPYEPFGQQICTNKLDDTTSAINDVNNSINNPNVDNGTGQGFFDDFTSQDFGLSQIVTIPLNTIQSLTSKSCVPLQVPIPFTNSNLSLPCMTEIYQSKLPTVYNLWKIVSFGIVAYLIAIDIFHMVKGFKDPESDKVEVLDL